MLPKDAKSQTTDTTSRDWETAWADIRRVIPQDKSTEDILRSTQNILKDVAGNIKVPHPSARFSDHDMT